MSKEVWLKNTQWKSGVHYVDPSLIIIPPERQRKDMGDRSTLMGSMSRTGTLVNPIVVTNEGLLVAGHRRLLSALDLKWPLVSITVWNQLSTDQQYEIELEENIGRKDLEWHEEAAAVAELDKRKRLQTTGSTSHAKRGLASTNPNKEKEEKWTLQNTADLLSVTKSKVSLDIKLAGAIVANPSLSKLTKTQALASLKREEISLIRKELAKRATVEATSNIYLGNCADVLPLIPSESVDLVITDPPYGVNVHNVLDDANAIMSEDNKFNDIGDVWRIILSIRDELWRVLVPGSHLYIFCATENFREIRDCYAEMFNVRRTPLIWYKMSAGKTRSPDYQWGNTWEPLLFASKGTRAFRKDGYIQPFRGDVLSYARVASVSKEHETEKPVTLLKDLIAVSSDEGEVVLDPFGGSGSTSIAAILSGRLPLTIELLESNVALIKSKCQQAIESKEMQNGVVGKEIFDGGDAGEEGSEAGRSEEC